MLCLAAVLQSNAQDVHFSQFFEAPLVRNPSLAGIFTGDVRVQGVYRSQWQSVTTPFVTQSLDAEYKMPVGQSNDFITLGMQILHDKAGTTALTTTDVYPALNYHKALTNDKSTYLSMGFMGGWVQNRFDRSKMTTNSMYNGTGDGETFLKPLYSYWDASVGISYNAQLNSNPENNFYIGAAYHHFNKPKNSFYQDPSVEVTPKTDFSAGIRFAVTDWSYVTLQANQSFQGAYQESILGGLYGVKLGDDPENPRYTVHGGVFFRVNDAIIPVLKMDYRPFAFSLSYDVNISQLRSSSYGRGGFELGVSYSGFTNRNNSTLNAVVCPKF